MKNSQACSRKSKRLNGVIACKARRSRTFQERLDFFTFYGDSGFCNRYRLFKGSDYFIYLIWGDLEPIECGGHNMMVEIHAEITAKMEGTKSSFSKK